MASQSDMWWGSTGESLVRLSLPKWLEFPGEILSITGASAVNCFLFYHFYFLAVATGSKPPPSPQKTCWQAEAVGSSLPIHSCSYYVPSGGFQIMLTLVGFWRYVSCSRRCLLLPCPVWVSVTEKGFDPSALVKHSLYCLIGLESLHSSAPFPIYCSTSLRT